MATTTKVSRKKLLKEPDEFISTTGRVIQFFHENQARIYRYAFIVLIVLAAGWGGFYYLRFMEDKALAYQSEGLKLYQEAYRAGLEKPGTAKKEDFQKPLDKFHEALSSYKWGKTSQVSELYIGNCYFGMKDYGKAEAAYSRCLDGPYAPLALNGIAYSYEAQGDYAKAVENFLKSAADRNNPFQLESMLGAARCYEASKQNPKALEIYRQALEQFPKSNMAEFIRWKMSELKG